MKKSEIYKIFVAGVNFGLKYGAFPGFSKPYPKESMFDMHSRMTSSADQDVKGVTWTVIIAGFNYGVNAHKIKPSEEKLQSMFENLIVGKPLEDDKDSYYTIKESIEKILTHEDN